MKVLLIHPVIREWAKPNCFPSGLGYLAAEIINAGHEVEIYDCNATRPSDEEFEKFIANSDYDLVGTGGIVTIYKTIKKIVVKLKEIHPDRPIIVGGSCGTSAPAVVMNRTPADFVCIGEGERTLIELLNVLQNNGDESTVNGIWYRKEDGSTAATPPRAIIKDIDALPLPRWDLFPMDVYVKNPIGAVNVNKWNDGSGASDTPGSMNLVSSRGCPYHCTYCYHDFMGAGYRFRSARNIFDEIVILKERYGVQYFHFTDDCFIINKNNVLEFCDLMINANLGVEWGCAGRVNLMTEELILKMKEAGCVFIGYGIESGSPSILESIKKKVKVEQAEEAIRLTQKHFGWADCSFIVGLPGETKETIRETIEFCKRTNLAPEVVFFATPYPGTELFDIAKKAGKIPDDEEFILSLGEQGEQVLVNFTEFSDEELIEIKEKMVEELGAWNKIKHD